jgi:outer membrane protein assembly factor BamA
LKKHLPKIALLFLIGSIFYSCSTVRNVPDGKKLLTKNEILVNETVVNNDVTNNLIYQKANSRFFGFPLRLSLYNLAKKNPDSSYNVWLHKKPNRKERLIKLLSEKQVNRLGKSFVVSGFSDFLKKTGEKPVIIDSIKIEKTKTKFKEYYFSKGYFNPSIKSITDSLSSKKAKITYSITTGNASFLDSISRFIETPELDELYSQTESESFLKKGNQFNAEDFIKERKRITSNFRNNGVYHFQINHINPHDIDTINTGRKVNIKLNIEDRDIKKGDTLVKTPFKIYSISNVNIYTINPTKKNTPKIKDSVFYKNYYIYSDGKLKYKPKALTNVIFIEKGNLFSDKDKLLTSKSIGNLKTFNFPNIEYIEDPMDENGLIANIYLIPRDKFSWSPSIDVTYSNIIAFGISGNMSVTWRNLFRRAEILEISTRGNIGSSKDFANPNDTFFNISEIGIDAKISFPRLLFPANTKWLIKKEMLPTTQMSVGLTRQRNIGLDKSNFNGILNYNWIPKENVSVRFDLLNIQYVQNLNVGNYFNVYNSSYNTLNDLAPAYNTNINYIDSEGNLTSPGAIAFIEDVINGNTVLNESDKDFQSIRSIGERRKRLIENNLIISSNYTYNKTTRSGNIDNSFYSFRGKLETAGNVASLISKQVKEPLSDNGKETLIGVEYAQYFKTELEYIKHWDLNKKNVFAIRTFFGIAIPYGNANSIPFSRSYFGGGSNDNRGWQAYTLGPGKSGAINDFNEANLKIAFSAEYRANILGKLYGALFADVGNIWNIYTNVTDENYTFNNIGSLQDLALGTGFGFRYDFNYFIFRLDFGYKTYNPAKIESERWLKDLNFSRTVLNFGINYPF